MRLRAPEHAGVLEAGDVIWIDFGQPFGHEQAGRRPALVVSPRDYNAASSLLLVCPITRNPRPWPYKIPLPPVGRLNGMVLVDQVKSVDRRVRFMRAFGRVPDEVLAEVRSILATLLGIPAPPDNLPAKH